VKKAFKIIGVYGAQETTARAMRRTEHSEELYNMCYEITNEGNSLEETCII
jgi:hypothetical protein